MRLFALALLVVAPLCASAQPPMPAPVPAPPSPVQPAIKLPPKLAIAAGTLGKLQVEGAAKSVEWVTLTPGLSVEATDDGRTLYLTGPSGTYELLAYTAIADVPSKPVRVTVVIGVPTPPPPPAPPAPPAPPVPADPLKARLVAAYQAAAGTAAQKAEWAKDLAALYRASAKLAADPTVATAAALKARLASAAGVLVGTDSLKEVRQAVKAELAALLPAADAELTADQRAAAAALFRRLAPLVEGLAQ